MTLCTLTLHYEDVSTNPYSGSVLFQPTTILQDTVNGVSIGYTGVSVTLDGTGSGEIELHFTDDPTITPNNPAYNVWAYRVQENVTAPGASFPEVRAPYFIALPTATGGSALLSDLPRTGQALGYGWFNFGIY